MCRWRDRRPCRTSEPPLFDNSASNAPQPRQWQAHSNPSRTCNLLHCAVRRFAQPLSFQPLPTSYGNTGGGGGYQRSLARKGSSTLSRVPELSTPEALLFLLLSLKLLSDSPFNIRDVSFSLFLRQFHQVFVDELSELLCCSFEGELPRFLGLARFHRHVQIRRFNSCLCWRRRRRGVSRGR